MGLAVGRGDTVGLLLTVGERVGFKVGGGDGHDGDDQGVGDRGVGDQGVGEGGVDNTN